MSEKKINDPSQKLEEAKKVAHKQKRAISIFDSLEEIGARFFRWLSSLIDKIFYSKKYVALFALVLAILLCIIVNINNSSIATNLSSSRTLTGVEVKARYNEELFELTGLPASCDVVITGDAANVNNAVSKQGYCVINLDGITEGSHTVKLETSGFGDYVTTVVVPSETQVTLKSKSSRTFEISSDFVNANLIDAKYVLSKPTFGKNNETKVNVRASQDTLNSIALVRALIDMSSYQPNIITLDNNQTDIFTSEVPLVAYDNKGQLVKAEIYPSTIEATVAVNLAKGRPLPIQVLTKGALPGALVLDEIKLDASSVILYGEKTTDDKPTIEIDLSSVADGTEIMCPIIVPDWVTKCEPEKVNATIVLAEAKEYNQIKLPLECVNNELGFADGTNPDDLLIKITCIGSDKNIEKLLDKYKEDNSILRAYIDATGKEAGEYDFEIKVDIASEFKNYIIVEPEKNSIKIELVERQK